MKAEKIFVSETTLEVDNTREDLCHSLRYHLLVKKEVYSLAQVSNIMMNCEES